jgi:hypothetical protein
MGGGVASDSRSPQETSPSQQFPEFDYSTLDDSLAKTPWERMLANDDAVQFGEMLRRAVRKKHAESS